MLIHCMIKREGPTPVILESTKYLFMPIQGSKKGEMTTSVCDITKQSHIDHLLKLPMYEPYDQEKIEKEMAEASKKPDLMKGFAVEKYSDAGYAAVDRRKKQVLYAGENGNWVKKGEPLVPFKTEMEVFSFLKMESGSEEDELQGDLDQLK